MNINNQCINKSLTSTKDTRSQLQQLDSSKTGGMNTKFVAHFADKIHGVRTHTIVLEIPRTSQTHLDTHQSTPMQPPRSLQAKIQDPQSQFGPAHLSLHEFLSNGTNGPHTARGNTLKQSTRWNSQHTVTYTSFSGFDSYGTVQWIGTNAIINCGFSHQLLHNKETITCHFLT